MDINAFGMSKARARIERGTTTKDLWFHLVRVPEGFVEAIL